MDESYLEALTRIRERVMAACEDGLDTLREVDDALIELSRWGEIGKPVSTHVEEILSVWVEARSGQVDDAGMIDALEVVVVRIDDQIANYRDWDSEEEYHIGHMARRRVMRGGLFESKLIVMVGTLPQLPDRGVVNKDRLKRLVESKKGK